MSETPDRRGSDRRRLVDLTRPAYLERRQRGGARRETDARRQRDSEAVLPGSARRTQPESVPVPVQPSKPLDELEADLAALRAAMDARNERLKSLSAQEYERSQVRHESLMIAWSVQVRRLEKEIAAARRGSATSREDAG
ncbi:MAG TPA: hypothetical protein VMH41_06270 [Mycobacteriales bacterium]|nr:hypothetical protein [Mycobacteriales bacterium]